MEKRLKITVDKCPALNAEYFHDVCKTEGGDIAIQHRIIKEWLNYS